MSTGSTGPRDSLLRRLGVPAAAAVLVGALAGGVFYYFVEVQPGRRRTNPAVARRVATTHTLIAIGGTGDEPAAFALIGRADSGPAIVSVPSSLVVSVPGLGPRTLTLALRDSGPGAAAVGLANELRITVPSSAAAPPAIAASMVDRIGGVQLNAERALRTTGDDTQTVFQAGPLHLSGHDFLGFMTRRFDESQPDQEARHLAGWRALFRAMSASTGEDPLRRWTTDVDRRTVRDLIRDSATSQALLSVPVSEIGLVGERLVRIDDSRLPSLRDSLANLSNGAETTHGRRIRLVVAADGPIGPLMGRILVNAGYVVELSGKAARRAESTRIAVSSGVADAESTGKDLAGLLGMGSVRVSTNSDSAADIMLVIGMDWAKANGFPQR